MPGSGLFLDSCFKCHFTNAGGSNLACECRQDDPDLPLVANDFGLGEFLPSGLLSVVGG